MNIRRTLVPLAALALGGAPALRAQGDDVTLMAMWGSGPNDIWVVGNAPAALHWDGQAWNEIPLGVRLSGGLRALWGSGPGDVFAVGDNGQILHYDGRAWQPMTSGTDRELVAVAGRSPTEVYALARSYGDREPSFVLRYNGQTWAATPLPFPAEVNGLALSGPDVLVAASVSYEPRPGDRRTVGVLGRMSAGRWTMSGWDGQRVSDEVAGGAGWKSISVGGSSVLLFGERTDGTPAIALSSGGGAWAMLPPAVSAMSRTGIQAAFAFGDGTPVALYDGPGFARYASGRWTPVVPTTPQQMMMHMMQQQQPGVPPPPQQQQQMMQMQQMMQNPMMMMVMMAAYDMSDARGAWGASANDFYVLAGEGRIVHVVGDQVTIAYDQSCSEPMAAAMNPVCQMLQTQRMQQPPIR